MPAPRSFGTSTRDQARARACEEQGASGEFCQALKGEPAPACAPAFGVLQISAAASDELVACHAEAAALEPLWSPPAPLGHNGGPPMPRNRPGRPSVATPEVRGRILDLLAEGVPLRVICRAEGMPSRSSVLRWRAADPGFARVFRFFEHEGHMALAEKVVEEVERVLERRGPEVARWIFNLRRQQLARMNPRVFGDRGMRA